MKNRIVLKIGEFRRYIELSGPLPRVKVAIPQPVSFRVEDILETVVVGVKVIEFQRTMEVENCPTCGEELIVYEVVG